MTDTAGVAFDLLADSVPRVVCSYCDGEGGGIHRTRGYGNPQDAVECPRCGGSGLEPSDVTA